MRFHFHPDRIRNELLSGFIRVRIDKFRFIELRCSIGTVRQRHIFRQLRLADDRHRIAFCKRFCHIDRNQIRMRIGECRKDRICAVDLLLRVIAERFGSPGRPALSMPRYGL